MNASLRLNWLIAIALVGWLMYLLAPILTPFVAAALLAYIGDPVADRLQRLKLPRTLAVAAVFLLTFLVLGLLVLLVGPLIRTQVGALLDALPEIVRQVEQVWLPNIAEMLDLEIGEDVGIGAFVARYGDMAGSWGTRVLVSVTQSGGAVAAAVLSLFLVPILTFYLLRDWDFILVHLEALIPSEQHDTVVGLARETDEVLGAFLRGQLLVMLALAIIYSAGLGLVGLKFAVAIGVVSGLVSFVPYLGFVFGIALASLTVVLEPDPLWRLVGVVATFSIAQALEGSLLTPKLVGDRIGLHPVLIIFAVAAGGQLFGFFGILLALPAAAVLSVLVRFAYFRYLKEHPEIDVDELVDES
ncbi:MAG: AI-2E family transporter [Gammaproteobacteria bacterium]|nr:AI-2E family transporter [Gammaproteobacteria bacterium]MDH3372887.1 AI-2E family transporter [Gammaproteobacteria bacterium]MDH3407960.1 AI-2E family transporter [Gammaproteobacteria bacterium]MDH3552265.1 AI-2E family transporter [Gammaproteobacteria bacterium]